MFLFILIYFVILTKRDWKIENNTVEKMTIK